MAGGVSFALGLIAFVFVQHVTAAAETVHVVGDATGWTIPPSPTFYSEWAAKNKFAVGDSLKFIFGTGAHDVAKVSKAAFEECNPEEPIGSVMSTGPATVKIDAAGEHYFICTVGKHCSGGQKLSITVSATSGGAAAAPKSSTSNTTTTATAPTTAEAPSHNDSSADAPATENSPSSSPTKKGDESTDAPAPTPSSSAAVMATLYVTLSAIVMSFMF